ncbi:phosphatidylinositol-specific phospholipase C [Parabacteroides bouchesdurhonensis]|uniref:phosphatidylinositol-specific phospholipase C n=1 Tax=Parabacteroides bouchesdurhonensis TaxID=1936995 RepID=UPI000C83C718|nr:phosphatidylinositol-specific phospholipase C [Parabacteroides bouchesdurhonensis]
MKHLRYILFFAFYILTAYSIKAEKPVVQSGSYSTWMKNIDDSTPLCKISIPGTHDSGASQHGGVGIITQDISIPTQLRQGIRCFDIRLQAMDNNKLGIYHGPFFQDIYWEENVLTEFIDFLKRNPSETLIVFLKKENGKITDYAHLLSVILEKPEYQTYFMHDFRSDITLGNCRGKILFLHRDHAMDNYPGAECSGWEDNATCTVTLSSKNGDKCFVTVEDEYQYSSVKETDYKTQICIRNIEKMGAEPYNSELWGFTFVSATAVPVAGPIHFAKINNLIAKHIQKAGKKNCGIVLFDFSGSKNGKRLTKALIDSNSQ